MADLSSQPDVGRAETYLTVRKVAEIFDVEPATVRVWLADGTLEGIKIGKGYYWRIPKSAVEALAKRRYGSESQND